MTRTIKIRRDTRELLRDVPQRSVDDCINFVLDSVELDLMDSHVLFGSINVDVQDETLERLKSFRVYEHESYDSVLQRALSIYMHK